MNKVYFITGAGRGMGVDFAKAALAAGHDVVATGRDPDAVARAVGRHDRLLTAALDITDVEQVAAAVRAAEQRFGRIDVLVNNAANFIGGFFEELTPAQVRTQLETSFFGQLNVTREVLPLMRRQRSGLVVTITSLAGLVANQFTSAYAASKFALEGWMEALTQEVAPFDIKAMLVEPGFFRTALLTPESTSFAGTSIDDYAERTAQIIPGWQAMNGKQAGDPAKLGCALISLCDSAEPPARWIAGADAIEAAAQKARLILDQIEAHRALSSSLAHEA